MQCPALGCGIICECASKHPAPDIHSLSHVLHSDLKGMQWSFRLILIFYVVIFGLLHLIGYEANRTSTVRASTIMFSDASMASSLRVTTTSVSIEDTTTSCFKTTNGDPLVFLTPSPDSKVVRFSINNFETQPCSHHWLYYRSLTTQSSWSIAGGMVLSGTTNHGGHPLCSFLCLLLSSSLR